MYRQATRVIGCARGRQHVVRARCLVAKGHGGFLAQKQRTVALQLIEPPRQIQSLHCQMFRGIVIRGCHHFRAVFAQNNLAIIAPCGLGILPVQLGQISNQAVHKPDDVLGQGTIVCDKPHR